jgi:hypothetical protein
MRTTVSVVSRLMITVAVCRLMIHVVRVVASACVGPRWCAAAIRWTALSIRAIVHHSIVIVIHLEERKKA